MNRDRGGKIVDGIRADLADVGAGSNKFVKRDQGELVTSSHTWVKV
jgi:hypothetical protein